MDRDPTKLRRIKEGLDMEKLKVTEKAERGDPEALHEILTALLAFLRGGSDLEPCFASYLRQALNTLTTESSKPFWSAAASEFQDLDQSQVSIEERVTGLTPRISEKTRRKFGNAFCRAFGLTKRPGKDTGYNFLLTPSSLWKVAELRRYGASLPLAIRIVRSVYSIKLSDRQIKQWILKSDWLQREKPGRYGHHVGEHHRKLRLATRVQQRVLRGMTDDDAFREVARIAVTELCRLPNATIYLNPPVVAEAYRYAKDSDDPRWERVERLARRFANVSQPGATDLPSESRTGANSDG